MGEADLSEEALTLEQQIVTTRLLLRPLCEADIDVVHEMSVHREVRRYLFEGQVIARSEVELMVGQSDASFQKRNVGLFAMCLSESPSGTAEEGAGFVGFCGLKEFEHNDMELLIAMHPNHWGKGYGHEAASAVLNYGFSDCGMNNIVAHTDTPNQRSVEMLQRLGMSFRERREWHGLDTVFYDICADDFLHG